MDNIIHCHAPTSSQQSISHQWHSSGSTLHVRRRHPVYTPSPHCHGTVGRIATCILKCSNFANLYLKNTNKTGMSGWTSEGRGFMPSSNKTYYSGHLCEENAIYSKTIRPELMEI